MLRLLLPLSVVLLSTPVQAQAPGATGADAAASSYSPIGKRDPFTPLIVQRPASQRQALTLVGVIWGLDAPQALVTTDQGTSLVLKVGAVLSDYSQVVQITETGLVREWTMLDLDSNRLTEQETLSLVQP